MTEVAQEYEGTVTVATAELNPRLDNVSFSTPENVHYNLFDAGVKYENVLIDLSIALPSMVWVIGANDGDEYLDFKVVLGIDGTIIIDKIIESIGPAISMPVIAAMTSTQLTSGSHICNWIISARRSGTSEPFVDYFVDSTTYYCYTLGLDAVATQVGFVQNGVEKNWLTWTGAEFVESPILIEPDTAMVARFVFSNAGDELVRLYVGHLAVEPDQYDTGIVIDGVAYDTIQPYVDIAAGGTGTLDVTSYVPTASFTVSFSVLRERIL